MAGKVPIKASRRRPERHLGRAGAVGLLLVLATSAPALAEGMVGVGANGAEGTYVAVALDGTANSSQGVAVGGTGSASGGTAAVSPTGNAYGGAVAVSGTGQTCGSAASANIVGSSVCGSFVDLTAAGTTNWNSAVTASGANDAHAQCRDLNGVCVGGIAASGLGNATGVNSCSAGTAAGQNLACGMALAASGAKDAVAQGPCTLSTPGTTDSTLGVDDPPDQYCFGLALATIGEAASGFLAFSAWTLDVPLPWAIFMEHGRVAPTGQDTLNHVPGPDSTDDVVEDVNWATGAATCAVTGTLIDLTPHTNCLTPDTVTAQNYASHADRACGGCAGSNILWWAQKGAEEKVGALSIYSIADRRMDQIHAHGALLKAGRLVACWTDASRDVNPQWAGSRYESNTTETHPLYTDDEPDPRKYGSILQFTGDGHVWTTTSGHSFTRAGQTWEINTVTDDCWDFR